MTKPDFNLDEFLAGMTPQEEAAVLERYRNEIGLDFPFQSLEDLVTSPDGFGLGVPREEGGENTATPLQRAICRVLEGRPLGELGKNRSVKRALGVDSYKSIPDFEKPPPEVSIIAAVRTAKSLIAAARALWSSQTVDVTGLTRGEIPRYSILSLSKDNAAVTFAHLVGALQQPMLRHLKIPDNDSSEWRELIDEASADFAGSVFVWHPSGRPVEIRVVAGTRAGGSLVSRWSVGVCFDEAPRMIGAEEGVVNYDDGKKAVRSRLLPGAQIMSIGSPWRAQGPIYDLFLEHWGNPTEERVVFKSNGPSMNPIWWNPDRCEEIRQSDPEAYKTDVLAEFLEPLEALINPQVIDRSARPGPMHIEYIEHHDHSAAMDPATRGNAWTFGIGDRFENRKRLCYHKEWQGTTLDPLNPKEMLIFIGRKLREYGMDWVYTDQWSADALRALADELVDPDTGEDISFSMIIEEWTGNNKRQSFINFRDACNLDTIELPPDPVVLSDLRLIRKRRTGDSFTIMLPKTGNNRHCDYAPMIVRLFQHWIDEELELPPEEGTEQYAQWLEEQMEAADLEEWEAEQQDDAWMYEVPYE